MQRALRCSALVGFVIVGVLVVWSRPAHAGLEARNLPRGDLLGAALAAYHRVEATGRLANRLLTIIDYSLPSTIRRLWVIDPQKERVLFHEFVAHGRGSALQAQPEWAVHFGNTPASHRSSLGTFLTGRTYMGGNGYSLELLGLDPGLNDRALERRIVMHPADYMSARYRARQAGRVGRSWGCPALDPAVSTDVIKRIQAGSVLYVDGSTEPPSIAPRVTALARADKAKAPRPQSRRSRRARASS